MRMQKQLQMLRAGAVLLAVLLATPAAATGRQLAGANFVGKGPRYNMVAPSAMGAFSQQRTYFVPAAATPVVAAYQQPIVASSYATTVQPVMAQQPLVVAAQSTVVAAQPTLVAAAPSFVAAAPKIDLGLKMNVGIEVAKSVQGNIHDMFSKRG